MAILDELGQYLVAQLSLVLGGNAGTLHIHELPDRPDTTTALLIYQGGPGDAGMGLNTVIEHPVVRIVSRGTSAATTITTANQIYNLLKQTKNTTMSQSGGTSSMWFQVIPKFAPIMRKPPRDANGRFIAWCDYDVAKRISA